MAEYWNPSFVEKPISQITHFLNALDNAAKKVTMNIRYIERREEVAEAVALIKAYDKIAFDCEGIKLGRTGKLSLIQIGIEDGTIFIFDILEVGVFEESLKELLESKSIVKIMFDCRQDSDALWHEHRVKLNNVLDVQLYEFICRGKAKMPVIERRYRNPVIRGMNDTYETYTKASVVNKKETENKAKVKTLGGDVMKKEKTVWRYRPLTIGLKVYAAMDIFMVWEIFEKLQQIKPIVSIEKKRLEVASQRYVEVRRDNDALTNEMFRRTKLLLSNIIPETNGSRQWTFRRVE